MSRYFAIAGILLASCPFAHAESIAAKKIASTLRLLPLTKLTVGPYDQYHGSIDSSGTKLIFTRKTDLAPHVCTQNIHTGEVSDFLPITADSVDPALSPSGQVAFIYYQFHSSGDVCHKPIHSLAQEMAEMKCLKIESGEPSSPFWKSQTELGYVLKDTLTDHSQIVVENLATGKKTLLVEGKVWSPSMASEGRYLFYNELIKQNQKVVRALIMKDLSSGTTRRIQFDLPGISGFPAVTPDEKYLYFSHYLNDTNNDGIIDGNDHSVIFRISLQDILAKKDLFPEQLTSVESNCSFPRPNSQSLIATCAFEESLDLYQLPLSGIVPSHWNTLQLNNAHETGRSYSDRILILNTLKYRYPTDSSVQLDEKILSNHLMADDLASSKYYLDQIKRNATSSLKAFYDLLDIYLEARQMKKIQKSNEITPTLQAEIIADSKKLDTIPGHLRFKKILKGIFQSYLNQPSKSAAYLQDIQFNTPGHSLERYFYFELAQSALTKAHSPEKLHLAYQNMMRAPELPTESHIYYAFEFLKSLGLGKHQLKERIALIQKMNHQLPKEVTALLSSEVVTLKVITSENDPAKRQVYKELDQLMSTSRDHYFLRKAMYIRSILNFAEAEEFLFLSFIATNWLRYTQNDNTEFAYAREVYAFSNLDQAYDALWQRNPNLASNYFFGSLMLTDDLESHYGYIQSKISSGNRQILNERYKNLKDNHQIEDNLKFVEALLILLDAHPSSKSDIKHLDLALEKLKSMDQNRDSAVRYLLLGYCQLEKLIRLGSGYEIDNVLFENAHHDLMLAYDQARDNTRIQASALMNLGILHQRAQNHGLAVQFFSKRKPMDFVSKEDSIHFSWLYARSLYFNHRPDKASKELQLALGWSGRDLVRVLPENQTFPLLERLGFYFQAAGQYQEATQVYESLLKSGKVIGDISLAKIHLSYGYSLFKLKDPKAVSELKKSLDFTSRLTQIPKSQDRWIDFQPNRIRLVAYGVLSQMGSTSDRLSFLEKRNSILKESESLLDQWTSTLIQNELQIAYLLRKTQPALAKEHLKQALEQSEKLGKLTQYLGAGVYRTGIAYLTHASLNPDLYKNESLSSIQQLVERTIQAYDKQPIQQPLLEKQKNQLLSIWNKYKNERESHHGK